MLCSISSPQFYYCQNGGNRTPFFITICVTSGSGEMEVIMKTENNFNDPRVKRTRKLIIDAFIFLVRKKDFESITVKDITEKATVNRATFYAHFQDKYSLFDFTLSNNLNEILSKNVNLQGKIDEDFIRSLVVSVLEYHQGMQETCKRSYMSLVSIMDEQSRKTLADIFYSKLKNHEIKDYDSISTKLLSIMVSNSISGSVCECCKSKIGISPEILVKEILPFIMGGIHKILDNKYNISL